MDKNCPHLIIDFIYVSAKFSLALCRWAVATIATII